MISPPDWIAQSVVKKMAYRGEYGDTPIGMTRAAAITFTNSTKLASLYAQEPNNHVDTPLLERVVPAWIRITRPVVCQTNADPFIEVGDLIAAVGRPAAQAICLRYSDYLCETSAFTECGAELDEAIATPAIFDGLYLLGYPLLDDHQVVDLFRCAGFDGAILGSSGEGAGDLEFRPFDLDQVALALTGEHLAEVSAWTRPSRTSFDHSDAQAAIAYRDSFSHKEVLGNPDFLIALADVQASIGSSPLLRAPLADNDAAWTALPRLREAPPLSGATGGAGWLSPAQVEEEVRRLGLGALLDRRILTIHRLGDTLPEIGSSKGGVMGVAVADNTLHLVAGRLRSLANVRGTLFHEGFHGLVPGLLGNTRWNKLMDRLDHLYEKARTQVAPAGFWRHAMKDIECLLEQRPNATRQEQVEEFGAYALSYAEELPSAVGHWVKNTLGFTKAWLFGRFGLQLGEVSPHQLAHLARMAMKATCEGRLDPAATSAARRGHEVSTPPVSRRPVILPLANLDDRSRRLLDQLAGAQLPINTNILVRPVRALDVYCDPAAAPRGTTTMLVAHGHLLSGRPSVGEDVSLVWDASLYVPEVVAEAASMGYVPPAPAILRELSDRLHHSFPPAPALLHSHDEHDCRGPI